MQNLKEMLKCKNETILLKYPLNIQLFADDPEPQDTLIDTPVDTPAEPQTPSSFTQKDIDDAIKDARESWEAEQEEQQTEAQKLAKMNKEQQEEYKRQKREGELKKREEELNKRELKATAIDTLTQKGLPIALVESLNYESADACNQSIEKIGKAFEDAVQSAVESRIKGTAPLKKSTIENTTSLTKEQVATMTPAEINANWEEVQNMMKLGQL